jgi:hypothetical protein
MSSASSGDPDVRWIKATKKANPKVGGAGMNASTANCGISAFALR